MRFMTLEATHISDIERVSATLDVEPDLYTGMKLAVRQSLWIDDADMNDSNKARQLLENNRR